jgi:hypothetical protein
VPLTINFLNSASLTKNFSSFTANKNLRMKKLCFVAGLSLCFFVAQAQVQKDEVEMVQTLWGKEKRQLTTELLQLTPAETTAFNPIFDQYLEARKKLGLERMNLIQEYADNYSSMTDDRVKSMAKGALSNNKALNKLHGKYFKKFSKALSPTKAGQWLQFESYIDAVVREEVSTALPFLKSAAPKK